MYKRYTNNAAGKVSDERLPGQRAKPSVSNGSNTTATTKERYLDVHLLLDIGVTSVNADDIFFMFQVFVVEVRRTPPTLKEGLLLMIVMLILLLMWMSMLTLMLMLTSLFVVDMSTPAITKCCC